MICARSRCAPTWGAQEHRRWDRLVAEHHYLPFHGVIGKGLRHVAVHGETWLALIGWQPGRVQAGRTRSLDRLAGGAAVPAPASDRQQLALCHPDAWPGAQLGLAGAGAEPAAAVAGHPGGAWISRLSGGDVRGCLALCRDLLPRVELALAGADPAALPASPEARRAGATTASPRRSSCSN